MEGGTRVGFDSQWGSGTANWNSNVECGPEMWNRGRGNIGGTTPLRPYWNTKLIGLQGGCSTVTEMAVGPSPEHRGAPPKGGVRCGAGGSYPFRNVGAVANENKLSSHD